MAGPLENPRQERFAQLLAAGKTADEAYQEAGYEANRHNASRLKTNETVAARVAELLGRAATNVVLSREWVLEKLIENANRAMQAEQAKNAAGEAAGEFKYDGSVANRALELLGKELGMFVDRSESKVDGTTRILSSEPMNTPEWERKYSGGIEPAPTEH